MDILEILRADYQQFPKNQTYAIYSQNVYFKDPLTEFCGLKRYQSLIRFMGTWFQDIHLDLHNIYRLDDVIHTEWTLQWTTPLPWQPRITIPGRSELTLSPEDLIISHIDYWNCSTWNVLVQHLGIKTLPKR